MTNRQKALLAILVGSLIGGATSPITKVGLQTIPPLSFAFIRFFLALLIIVPILIPQRKIFFSHFTKLIPFSLFATGNIIFFTLGVKLTTATISLLLYAFVPSLVALYLFLFLKQRLSREKLTGVILGFIGTCVVVVLPLFEKGNVFSGDLRGNLLICIAVVFWSLYMVRSKWLHQHYSPFTLTAHFIFVTTIVLLPLAFIESVNNYLWIQSMSTSGIGAILYVSLAATIVSYVLNQYAIKHGGSVFASMNLYLQPILGFIAANLILGEQLTTGILIGGLLVIAGVYLVTKR